MAALTSLPDEVVSECILQGLDSTSRRAFHCTCSYQNTELKRNPLVRHYLAACTIIRFMKFVVSVNVHLPAVRRNKSLHGRGVVLYGLKNQPLAKGIAFHSTDNRYLTGIGISQVVPQERVTVYWADRPSTWPVDYLRVTFCEYYNWSEINSVHIGPRSGGYTLEYYRWSKCCQ